MTDANTAATAPPVARVLGFLIAFLTIGIGVLRSVEPSEILTRAFAAGVVTWVIACCFSRLWLQMADGILNDDE